MRVRAARSKARGTKLVWRLALPETPWETPIVDGLAWTLFPHTTVHTPQGKFRRTHTAIHLHMWTETETHGADALTQYGMHSDM